MDCWCGVKVVLGEALERLEAENIYVWARLLDCIEKYNDVHIIVA